MQSGYVTTPFGRRPMTLTLVGQQIDAAEIKAGKKADKWKVFRDISEARVLLGLQDRSLAVLDALLSFYPESELRAESRMIVFPSNTQLALRAHGIAGATLRRHIAALVEAGLLVRKDSANGKRYARKNSDGEIDTAFGFDLSPLLVRSEELATLAHQVVSERATMRKAREDLTICRRDVRKLISAAIDEGAAGDWVSIEARYIDLVSRIPRSPTLADIRNILDLMLTLREDIVNHLTKNRNSRNISSNADQNERHIHNSNTKNLIEPEPAYEKEQGAVTGNESPAVADFVTLLPLGLVLRACPEAIAYAPSGMITSWQDLVAAATVIRATLGISSSAYQDACDTMGSQNAAVTIACILERSMHINSAGGYLRELTVRAKRDEFSPGPMLMALLRSHGGERKRV